MPSLLLRGDCQKLGNTPGFWHTAGQRLAATLPCCGLSPPGSPGCRSFPDRSASCTRPAPRSGFAPGAGDRSRCQVSSFAQGVPHARPHPVPTPPAVRPAAGAHRPALRRANGAGSRRPCARAPRRRRHRPGHGRLPAPRSERAAETGSSLWLVEMDTPGGLDTSMCAMIKDILVRPCRWPPLSPRVAPARPALHLYILYASYIAAMAPATNLVVATPVAIGIGGLQAGRQAGPGGGKPKEKDAMSAKAVEDAIAYIRSPAHPARLQRVDFAVRAVTEAASSSSAEALKQKVIDLGGGGPRIARSTGRPRGHGPHRHAINSPPPGAANGPGAAGLAHQPARHPDQPAGGLVPCRLASTACSSSSPSPGFGVAWGGRGDCPLLALYAFHLPVNWAGVLLLLWARP